MAHMITTDDNALTNSLFSLFWKNVLSCKPQVIRGELPLRFEGGERAFLRCRRRAQVWCLNSVDYETVVDTQFALIARVASHINVDQPF